VNLRRRRRSPGGYRLERVLEAGEERCKGEGRGAHAAKMTSKGASFPDHREGSGFIVSFCMTDGQVKVIFDGCAPTAKRQLTRLTLEPG
jgi:hypothetical protein